MRMWLIRKFGVFFIVIGSLLSVLQKVSVCCLMVGFSLLCCIIFISGICVIGLKKCRLRKCCGCFNFVFSLFSGMLEVLLVRIFWVWNCGLMDVYSVCFVLVFLQIVLIVRLVLVMLLLLMLVCKCFIVVFILFVDLSFFLYRWCVWFSVGWMNFILWFCSVICRFLSVYQVVMLLFMMLVLIICICLMLCFMFVFWFFRCFCRKKMWIRLCVVGVLVSFVIECVFSVRCC